VGCASSGGELSSGGLSTKVIGNGCSYANGKVLVEGVGENLLPSAQSGRLWRPGPAIAAPGTGNRHIDLLGHLIPGQALVTQLQDLLGGGWICGWTGATDSDPGTAKPQAHRGRDEAQLCTDLTKGPALGVQVGCTFDVHCATVTASCDLLDRDDMTGLARRRRMRMRLWLGLGAVGASATRGAHTHLVHHIGKGHLPVEIVHDHLVGEPSEI
jgi:hypothetical protein